MTWLLTTLAWTGALIALVLLVRRPVAFHFGAQAAYALWLLPLARLALPPVTLPAWMAPAKQAEGVAGHELVHIPSDVIVVESPAVSGPAVDWGLLLIALWLAGAAVFISLRLASYARLRHELLNHARPVGEVGRIRLVETPATASPLAFGVLDKVIALPPGFMASPDRRARDLALAHEIAHHRAHDLAVNFAALPLFALHWFNPLARLGWQAMRRDQEAACDARVVARCDRKERAAYATLIAHAVAGPRGALAAPMACPVLGDKSIIHRLRTIAMTDISSRRRRAGLAMVGAAALFVPLTASFSYAQSAAPEPPLPPAPPAAPAAPDAPLPPPAPLPPEMHRDHVMVHEGPEGAKKERRVVVIQKSKDGEGTARVERDGDVHVFQLGKGEKLDDKELEKKLEELGVRLGNLDKEMEGRRVVIERRLSELGPKLAMAEAHRTRALAAIPRIVEDCSEGEGRKETTTPEGNRVIRICRKELHAPGVSGLRAARSQIARAPGMDEATKAEVLRSLDREIERLEAAK